MPLPLPVAARELGVQPRTLSRWLRQGAPAARRGRRGRGGGALVDVDAVRAWRGCAAPVDRADLIVLASEIPELVGDAMLAAHRQVEGAHKRATAGALAAAWVVTVHALLDRLRRDVPTLADPTDWPAAISTLAAIYRDPARKTGSD